MQGRQVGQGWLASACGRRVAVDLTHCQHAVPACMAAMFVQLASGCLVETHGDLLISDCLFFSLQSARRRMRMRRAFTIERSE